MIADAPDGDSDSSSVSSVSSNGSRRNNLGRIRALKRKRKGHDTSLEVSSAPDNEASSRTAMTDVEETADLSHALLDLSKEIMTIHQIIIQNSLDHESLKVLEGLKGRLENNDRLSKFITAYMKWSSQRYGHASMQNALDLIFGA